MGHRTAPRVRLVNELSFFDGATASPRPLDLATATAAVVLVLRRLLDDRSDVLIIQLSLVIRRCSALERGTSSTADPTDTMADATACSTSWCARSPSPRSTNGNSAYSSAAPSPGRSGQRRRSHSAPARRSRTTQAQSPACSASSVRRSFVGKQMSVRDHVRHRIALSRFLGGRPATTTACPPQAFGHCHEGLTRRDRNATSTTRI